MKVINYRVTIDKQFISVIETGKHLDNGARPSPTKRLVRNHNVLTNTISGTHVFTLSPKSGHTDKVVLFLHGGAFLNRAVKQHWDFIGLLIKYLHCTVVFPDYPLVPENSYKEVFERVEIIYRDLIKKHLPENIILMGDSAGGGLALALAQSMRDSQIEQPAHIIMLSPWLDLSMTNPRIREIEKKDPFLPVRGLKMAGEAYAKGLSVKNLLVSPIYGDCKNLGKLSLFTGTYDVLSADAGEFKNRCDEQGIGLNYFEYPKMIHDWMLFGFPESIRVVKQINSVVNNTVS